MDAMGPSPLAASLKLFGIRFVGVNPGDGHDMSTLRITHDGRALPRMAVKLRSKRFSESGKEESRKLSWRRPHAGRKLSFRSP